MKLPKILLKPHAGIVSMLPLLASTLLSAQAPKPVISLDPQEEIRATLSRPNVPGEASFAKAPENFRSFDSAKVGELAALQQVTLHFSASTKLTKIESTKDFPVEQGSSCVEGNIYNADGSCTLLVRFTPQGAGRRLGKIKISHSASATPFAFGLGGNGYAPVLSFTPAQISSVSGTIISNAGIFNNAHNLVVDGSDTLYVADTGNNEIRSMDASGKFITISSGTLSAPEGVIADNFGEVYFTEPASNALFEIYTYGLQFELSGSTAGTCTTAAPCNASGSEVYKPGEMAIDPYSRVFFVDGDYGAAEFVSQSTGASYAHIYDPFTYQATTPGVIAVDSSDNLYSYWNNGATCAISMQSFYNSSNNYLIYQKVAGGKTCGFAGDGGLAGNAEISTNVGQMAFDAAGNLYFTDTANQRVRRIDQATGIISTIAGTGSASNCCDSIAATSATIDNPTGVAVDSQGQVYVLSTANGSTQSIRRLGVSGYLGFANQVRSTSSAALIVKVSNTGNSTMTLTSASITGTAAADYSIDPQTTSCLLTVGSTLASGQSCKVGVIFKPSTTGSRPATLVFLDNTVTNQNSVLLVGSGILPSATVAITSPVAGSSYTSGTSIPFKTSVTYSTTPAPTGTVKFTLDGTVINSGAAISSGVASVNATVSSVGPHTLSVTYSGDSNYAASSAVTTSFTVTAASSGPKKNPPVADPIRSGHGFGRY